ncbi:uncharacterized protein F5Z01DRAFT_673403 [Emericellopsis atlantica]|uniref:Uncharacterized protein n=1 Tax=Emericellopsis atlantica TaxID=2614577 RepID=A0A9P7ZNU9_9HYPO|nr:uncharacterized protein F5Z01DRAFT_673403 [Emericellopsis atlantica]KAG9255460.1 hypothetical protein F5Z01DRAFT_673403 [Emericellopsis atlantica]
MSSDTVSDLFPERPIRPLPKRRLREKLSPEEADSIRYPSSTLNSVPLFQYPPFTVREERGTTRLGSLSPTSQVHRGDLNRNWTPRRDEGYGLPSGHGGDGPRITTASRSPPGQGNRVNGRAAHGDQSRHPKPQTSLSATSSVDGYDSFENTNNKKKRKIPSAGDSALSNVHGLAAEVAAQSAQVGVPSTADTNGDRGYHNGSGGYGANSPGLSGSGRGRLGRSRNGRSPLRTISDNNAWWSAGGRHQKTANSSWEHQVTETKGGIISNAIANAGKHPLSGQENVSLLQQHNATTKPTPASTQFTFTCDSQVPGSIAWPGHTTRGGSMNSGPVGMMPPNSAAQQGNHVKPAPKKLSRKQQRKRLDGELREAARERQRIAVEKYWHNPPKPEDFWMCEFCEYEQIFGEPPRALIREYELKDRRARQEEADRKRLLEKAKAKGRKGRKNSKAQGKAQHAPNQQLDRQEMYDPDIPPNHDGQGQSTQSEEDYEEDYVAEYDDYSSTGVEVDAGGGELPSPRAAPIQRPPAAS